MISESTLIEHCSLTLASIKTGSLFTVKFENKSALSKDIEYWNEEFSRIGLKITPLKMRDDTALIYMYRKDLLLTDLNKPKARKILAEFGYCKSDIIYCIDQLSHKLSKTYNFPHEIGLFLGYPPDDVEGFICNKGQNCSLCKYWKVYGDKNEALLKFAQYDKCRKIYRKLWQDGRDIMQLTVKKMSVA